EWHLTLRGWEGGSTFRAGVSSCCAGTSGSRTSFRQEKGSHSSRTWCALAAHSSGFTRRKRSITRSLGNIVPHLHAHIQPRYHGAPYPGGTASPTPGQAVALSADKAHEDILRIRDALAS